MRLTLATAAVVVPANVVVRARRGVDDRQVRLPRKDAAHGPHRGAVRRVAGHLRPHLRAGRRAAIARRRLAARPRHSRHLRVAGHRPRDVVRDVRVRGARGHHGDGVDRAREGGGRGRSRRVAAGRRSGTSRSRASAGGCSTASSSATRARWASSARSRSVSGHVRGDTNTLPLHVEALYEDYRFSCGVRGLLAARPPGGRHSLR